MVKRRTFTLIAIAALLALGAALAANNWALARTAINAELRETETQVVVASVAIPYGQKIEEQHVNLAVVPKSIAPANAYTSTMEVVGRVAKLQHYAGEVLREERFAEHDEGSTLAAMIEKRKRAVTVRVNDVVGVAGFLLPGNRVDVLATRKEKKSRRAITDTVLYDIKVLAVDQTASTDKAEPVIVRAVTLEMTPPQAEILVKARDEGNIQLSLRNPLDQTLAMAPPPVKKVAKKKTKRRRVNSRYITVIRGTNVNVVKR